MMDELPVSLPGICTDITTQKKKNDRVSLFVDGVFLHGFHISVIQNSGIRKGDEITQEALELLQRDERRFQLKEQVYRWLGVRNHSTGEIFTKSRQKGYSSEEITEIIQEFLNKRLLNDELFALQFAESRAGSRAWGPVKIRRALSQKGVKKQYIDRALEEKFPNDDVDELMVEAARTARRRLMRAESGIKRKKKLVDFLVRRGFPGNQVFEKAEYLLKQLENEEN